MYEIFWEYEVRPEQVAAFERLYGADGEWARLFRQSDGYVETLLFRDTRTGQRATSPSIAGNPEPPSPPSSMRPAPPTQPWTARVAR